LERSFNFCVLDLATDGLPGISLWTMVGAIVAMVAGVLFSMIDFFEIINLSRLIKKFRRAIFSLAISR